MDSEISIASKYPPSYVLGDSEIIHLGTKFLFVSEPVKQIGYLTDKPYNLMLTIKSELSGALVSSEEEALFVCWL